MIESMISVGLYITEMALEIFAPKLDDKRFIKAILAGRLVELRYTPAVLCGDGSVVAYGDVLILRKEAAHRLAAALKDSNFSPSEWEETIQEGKAFYRKLCRIHERSN